MSKFNPDISSNRPSRSDDEPSHDARRSVEGDAIIVTGAARGIGACIARTLARAGVRLFLADVLLDDLEGVASALRATGAECQACHVDISQPESAVELAAAAVRQMGRIDALVNNAGLDAPPGLAWEIDESHWQRIIDVNLSGSWWVTKAVLPTMMAQRRGRVVFISSLAARTGSPRYSPAYAAAKAGLLGLTVGLAAQLEQFGILVNAITPGATGTTGTPMSDQERVDLSATHPLGPGGPQPIADGVRYLLDASGSWTSGAVLNVSGGQLVGI